MMVSRVVFYCLKLPAMMVLIVCGLLLDVLVQLPFLICFYIDGCFKKIKGMRWLTGTEKHPAVAGNITKTAVISTSLKPAEYPDRDWKADRQDNQ